MRTEVTKLDRSQRNRLLGKETERAKDDRYLCEVEIRPTNGKEYYKNIYDMKGKRVGGNLSKSDTNRA